MNNCEMLFCGYPAAVVDTFAAVAAVIVGERLSQTFYLAVSVAAAACFRRGVVGHHRGHRSGRLAVRSSV